MERPKLDRPTQDRIFADLDHLKKKYGKLALPGIRKYLTLYKERERRQSQIRQLEKELTDLRKKG